MLTSVFLRPVRFLITEMPLLWQSPHQLQRGEWWIKKHRETTFHLCPNISILMVNKRVHERIKNIPTFFLFSFSGLSPMQNACVWVWLWFTARLSVQSLTWLMEDTPHHACATQLDTQGWSFLVRTHIFVECSWSFSGFLRKFVGPKLHRLYLCRKTVPVYCWS